MISMTMFKVDQNLNMDRIYTIEVSPHVMGEWMVVCANGRYGKYINVHDPKIVDDYGQAIDVAKAIIRKRLKRGYSFRRPATASA